MAPLSGTHPPGGVAGAVLCGGASSRMGSPKPLVEWHGVAMARRVADVLVAAGCEPVRCVGGDAAALADLGLDTVTDLMPGEGPLGGVLTALRSSGVDAVLVVSCDIPMLTAQTAARLLDEWRSGGAQVVVAHTDRAQPLCAVWGRTVEPAIADALATGERSIRRLLPSLGVALVAVDGAELRNVNTPADLAD